MHPLGGEECATQQADEGLSDRSSSPWGPGERRQQRRHLKTHSQLRSHAAWLRRAAAVAAMAEEEVALRAASQLTGFAVRLRRVVVAAVRSGEKTSCSGLKACREAPESSSSGGPESHLSAVKPCHEARVNGGGGACKGLPYS